MEKVALGLYVTRLVGFHGGQRHLTPGALTEGQNVFTDLFLAPRAVTQSGS